MADHSNSISASKSAPATRFHNLTNAMLADEIGRLDVQSKALETDLKAAKDAFKARGISSAQGERFAVDVTDAVRWTIDTAAIKAEMGEAWFTRRSKSAMVSTLRISGALPAVAIAA